MFFYRVLAILLVALSYNVDAQSSSLRIPQARSSFDISHDYHKTLLTKALTVAANGREVPKLISTMQMSQGRAAQELMKNELIDVYWLGTDKLLEQNLRAIKVPTTRGLIGFRKFIIHKDSITTFDNITTLAQLKKLVACQGTHWPDTKILQAANLAVTTTPIYEDMFKMLAAKRCDYFPRGYHDSDKELILRQRLYPELTSYHGILLHYPFAVYYFTNKQNETLASWIEQGLTLLAKQGEITKLMQTHVLTAHVFPLKNESHVRYFDIANPLLSPETDVTNQHYWFLPSDFNLLAPVAKQ